MFKNTCKIKITMSKICRICLNNDILCQACDSKLKAGKISLIEVDISRAINKLSIDADFAKAVYNGMVYILAEKKSARMLIGRGGRNSKQLETALKKKIRIIEKSEEKDVIEGVLGTGIIGINVLYTPKEIYRIRVQKIFRNRVKNEHVRALNELLEKTYEIVFE